MAESEKVAKAPRTRKPPAAASGGASGQVTPRPPETLHVTPWTLSAKQSLHRIHLDLYAGDQFNPGLKGNARFSPIRNPEGRPIPTLYAAVTFDAAAMESVFHDVSHAPGYKQHDKRKLEGQLHSEIEVTQDLKLADLGSVALRKLGVQRRLLIDTEKDQYPTTRGWAEAIHAQHQDVQGLSWISRQDDSARAVMLFGDRVPPGTVQQVGDSRHLLGNEQAYAKLLDLADRIGVDLVPGRET
ncbi:RES family NAD+ phosphorylase [Paucibacter sp. O1-1]|nr:RES family NAD+ phosphorylase [Paucibacter sp. O1-1]MDA3824963.1 RES family NAD+ phosphorylase [Paucibacter sp. O1-1]